MSNIHEINVADENLFLELWQYDAGQKLKFVTTTIADGSHVLFANSETRKAIRKEVANNQVGIPNKFLRATGKMHITIETFNENEETTLYEINGYIKRRQDGEPGTAPEDEPTFIQKIVQAIKDLQEAVANNFYTKKETDDKDDLTLDTAKNYTDGIAEDLDRDIDGLDDRLDDVEEALPTKEPAFTVSGHLSKADGVLATDACKVYEYQYTFNKSAYPGIKEKDLIYNYTNINSAFHSDLYFITDASGAVLKYREVNGDAIRVFKSVDNPPTISNDGYNPGDLWQKYSSPTFNIHTLICTYICIAENGGLSPATIKWVKLTDDVYTTGEIATILLDYGKALSVSIDPLTYVCTFQLKNGNSVLSTATIDLPLESVVVSGSYDAQTKKIILTLQSGQTVEFSVADLVSGLVSTSDLNTALADYQPKITAQNKLDADLLDDSTSTKKTVTQQEKDAWSGKQDAIGPNNKVSADNVDDTSSTNKFVPSSAQADSGKFLVVDSNGNPIWKTIPRAEDNSF